MHRILRQTLEVSTATEAGAREVQAVIGDLAKGRGAAALAEVFDRIGRDRVLRLDRLEIDLGIMAGEGWTEEFLARLRVAVQDGLQRCHDVAEPQEDAGNAEGPRARAAGARDLTAAETRAEALAAYLEIGRLPWWSEIDPALPDWFGIEFAALAPAAAAALAKNAARRGAAFSRLIRSMPAAELARLLPEARWRDEASQVLPELAAACARTANGASRDAMLRAVWHPGFAEKGPASTEALRLTVCRAIAEVAAMSNSAGAISAILREAAANLPRNWQQSLQDVAEAVSGQTGNSHSGPGADAGRAGNEKSAGTEGAPAAQPLQARAPGAATPPGTPPEAAVATLAAVGSPAPAQPGAGEAIAVEAAGLVLLHPFLPELFERARYASDGCLAEGEARHKAARLLGHVGLGDAEADEARLTLARLLAGVPEDEALLPDPPAAEAIAAAEAMLAAVLSHWAALRSASSDWLRAQFLERDGLLRTVDAGWSLQVETRAQDVLLAGLPWGFGTVVLPWMGAPIHVRWLD
ncbi:contractile injection system tape measure protein [Marimonas arenosa]|uniref:Contractile injection system tape measure protein n=1 Tax=Marimonas arenosa TaxID=1795305 RepID=A0AAE3W9A7_9RHOB|nr:contractile injection system tape measure protein [Marimonas arenosa]MDQ2088736.1 contractile injection system tape measure protein [Marimonas arenosa]